MPPTKPKAPVSTSIENFLTFFEATQRRDQEVKAGIQLMQPFIDSLAKLVPKDNQTLKFGGVVVSPFLGESVLGQYRMKNDKDFVVINSSLPINTDVRSAPQQMRGYFGQNFASVNNLRNTIAHEFGHARQRFNAVEPGGNELDADRFANAVNFLSKSNSGPYTEKAIRAMLDDYEKNIGGTKDMVTELLKNPLYAEHKWKKQLSSGLIANFIMRLRSGL